MVDGRVKSLIGWKLWDGLNFNGWLKETSTIGFIISTERFLSKHIPIFR